jgi:succinylarginine dihydrolase
MTDFIEVQCDGLIGASHNYAGLSFGNIASTTHASNTAYPRAAALQGLEKMRFVHSLGIPQVILPPPLRPNLALLNQLGVELGTPLQEEERAILRAAYSASTMWSANAATVSPAPDTDDGALHFTIANLSNSLHRSQEASERTAQFHSIFGEIATLHPALPACTPFNDEGAANHMRLSPSHGEAGVEIFVYGRDDASNVAPARFPARHTKRASKAVARLHHLPEARVILAQQHPHAIDAGVFHNDVIAMSNGAVMIYHQWTFFHEASVLEALQRKATFPLTLIRVDETELPLRDAVASYFFNSQLLTLPSGEMVIIAPLESHNNETARTVFDRLVQAKDNPIAAVHYLDVRESMQNGGGPACLRLRVVMRASEFARIPLPYRFTEARFNQLSAFIAAHYPEVLIPDDLYRPETAEMLHHLHKELMTLFVV